MKRGDVYRFNYLWGHEAEKAQTGSKKIRRVCLMMQVENWLLLFPITSLEPQPEAGEERLYVEIPETEKRRVGLSLDKPSYLVLDDYNKVRSDELYDFASMTPTGSLSPRFVGHVARHLHQAIQEKRPIRGLIRR
ncbi:hypothetical protein [Bosea sp. ANAM02]|uniref:hypothetical protein n=1 Tax=Bosea sp. ANAM02 TaxID=2020412 RepID=UPI00140EA22D|nr:hypothetical protein [Bosea sp. ANAM02]BCB17183.1 hypothetical protein OCUBac02_00770 [Bosea sp. ANAM02]